MKPDALPRHWKQRHLVGGLAAVEEDVGGRLLRRGDAEGAQVLQVGDGALAAGAENAVGALGADAGDSKQGGPVGAVQFYGRGAQVDVGPSLLGVDVEAEVLVGAKADVLGVPVVVAQKEAGLVETVLPLQ